MLELKIGALCVVLYYLLLKIVIASKKKKEAAERRKQFIATRGYDPSDINSLISGPKSAEKKSVASLNKKSASTYKHLDSYAAERRKMLIAEKGYDPYDINSVMSANGIKYSSEPKKVDYSYPSPSLFDRIFSSSHSSRSRAPIYDPNEDGDYEGGGYVYRGESDPVHRKHHYEKDEYGRRHRVYDDDGEDRDDC